MLALLAFFYYLDANFAIKYLLGYTSMILFMFFLTFILIEFSFFTPVDTLNLAVRCSPSYCLIINLVERGLHEIKVIQLGR